MNLFKRAFSLLVVLIAIMVAVSCTTERDAVDKSPELSLDKRLFEGEFFLRQTITRLPYTADYAFIGESNDGKIVKWKITENWLVAYSIWDKLNVVDTNEALDVNETPIVAYRIAGHYDIVPSENPTTGEALPVLSTNTDRPWNERRYILLADDSRSGVSNYELKYLRMTMEWGAPFYRAGLTNATDWEFYAHDGTFIVPKDYREYTAIASDQERFNKEVEWFQFYSTEYFEPINSWGNIYTMADVEEFVGNEPAQVTYRYVFTKVNRDVMGKRDYDIATREFKWKKGSKDNGFRPLEFQDELFREYGYFTNNFKGYDNYHGYKDDNYHILANYWNAAWSDSAKNWNFKCGSGEDYNTCLDKLKYQQKVVFVSSPKTPLRMIPINCAIAKDYNYSLLAARYAAMNPGSDPREFDKWYLENYENDFFTTVDGKKVRDSFWYMSDLNDSDNPHSNWEEKCFVPEKYAWIQNWDGSFIDEGEGNEEIADIVSQYKNDIVVLIKNPVEAYLPTRDGKSLYGYDNYYNLSSTSRENAVKVCVLPEEANQYTGEKAMVFETCYKNNEKMSELYVDENDQAEWRGDRWDCQIFGEKEDCPDGYVEAKAACVMNNERTCEVEDGNPVLRHKYDNGNNRAALINWVDTPTDYGILGVSQWNVNPETGMSMSGGSNIAGSVLAWVTTRAIDLARMVLDQDDPAAWDWSDLVNPDYTKYPEVMWDNDPDTYEPKIAGKEYNLKNTMHMVNKKLPAFVPGLPIDKQEGILEEYNKIYQAKAQKYDRFDFSAIKDTKWESKMVPYSIKRALFPWNDPADNPTYSDAEEEIMETWYGGVSLLEAEMIRFIDARAYDYDFDESFLDGSIINFIKEKQKVLQESNPNWNDGGSGSEKYANDLIYAIYNDLEKLLYKGVAQHEMGHTMGLRHNFAGSTDVNNYLDSYYASRNYPALMEGVKNLVEQAETDGVDPALVGDRVWEYKRTFESDINYYTYTSVMDYQREAYIHAGGLGKYDHAAFKAVYGRSIEQYAVADGATYGPIIKEGDENDPNPELVNPLRDPKYPDYVRVNTPFLNDDGTFKKVKKPRELVTYYDESGKKVELMTPRFKRTLIGNFMSDENTGARLWQHDCDGNDPAQYYCEGDTTYLINDGSHYNYVFVSDEKSRDEPMANVFDAGYTGTDIIRQMIDMDDMFYYLRFFRRGSPKFREFRGRTSMKMIMDSLFKQYKFVHFLLDYNFYAFGKWFRNIPLYTTEDGCGTMTVPIDENTTIDVTNYHCKEHSSALKGIEYWIDETTGDLRQVEPMGLADHALAGMKGVQYLLFENMYRPGTGEYYILDDDEARDNKLAPEQPYYYQTTDNMVDGISSDPTPFGMSKGDFIEVPGSMGRYHRDRYDIQDNPSIYYDKVIRRGFAEEKMVTLFTLSNSGWFDSKYRRESRANSLYGYMDGLENVVFNVLSDISTEESVFTFSPYCVDTELNNKIVKVKYPINLLTNYGAVPTFWPTGGDEKDYMYDPVVNLCAMVDSSNPGRYVPLHAGWIYFDKMWPNYWAMGNMANISADTSVLRRWITNVIPVHEISLYPTPDVNEEQFLNQDENNYYRASIPVSAMDNADASAYRAWRACRTDLLENDVEDFTPCLAVAVWPEWHLRETITDAHPDWTTEEVTTEVERIQNDGEDVRFASINEFKEFLGDKYARYSPSYRVVRDAKILKEKELFDAASGSAEPYSRLVIMETTLDQLNTFVKDQFGQAAFYVSHY